MALSGHPVGRPVAQTYVVSKRGPKGEPLEIRCEAHPDCTWRMVSSGPKADDNPIFRAQFADHLERAKTPDAKAGGHMRRRRA